MANFSSVLLGSVKFSLDYHRCGKCMTEYESLEDFICHKVTVERCSLVLSESKKLLGIQLKIPSFIESEETGQRFEDNALPTADREKGNDSDNKLTLKRRKGRPRKNDRVAPKIADNLIHPSPGDWNRYSCKNLSEITEKNHYNDLPARVRPDRNGKLIITESELMTQLRKPDEQSNECTCPKCGNKYKDAIVLKTHIRTVHCDLRPFKCKFDCSLSFKTKGSLMRHMRRHTGERPFKCKQCNRSFRESGALTRHLKSRFPCSTKSDNDLGRYGKTVGINEYDSVKSKSTCHLPGNISTLKVIITDISNQSRDSFTEGQDVSYSSDVECGSIINDITPEENSNYLVRLNGEEMNETTKQNLNSCSKFERKQDILISFGDQSHDFGSNELSCKARACNSGGVEGVQASEKSNVNVDDELLCGNEELKCLACLENFTSKPDLKSHLMSHVERLPFRCIQCCFICQTKQQLVKHQRKKHGILAECTVEKNSEYLIRSMAELEEEDINIQDVVKQLFRTQNSIEAEELEFSGLIKKPAKHSSRCHICLKRFSCSLYLGCHMGTHTGDKPYTCDICKKSFFLKDSLKKHSVCHSDERRYRCGECYKSFKRLSHARDHLRIHSSSYPYQCTKCGKAFRWQATLKSHELSHGGPALRLHHCDTCGRRFPSKWSLVRHQRLHSSEASGATQSCVAKFGASSLSLGEFSRNEEKDLACISDQKVINLAENAFLDQKQGSITFEDQVSSISVTSDNLAPAGQTYVLITQEDGSSCLVPTVAIVEELHEETSAVNNIEGSFQ
ncbi:zinc finger protein 271-like [Ischnura elegans]|uniref:zinc finger protein 271-like n=1 Tax=Ischnura elegans TaxID=197161 RepID=UPI001ED89392|nr:zinc finger protein 271-like [Ischnura elegans]